MVKFELFIIFMSDDTFDFDEFFENFAEFAVMDKVKVFDIGKAVTQVASTHEDIEKVLSTSRMRTRCVLVKNWMNGILGAVSDNAGIGLGISKIKIADKHFMSVKDGLTQDGLTCESIGNAFAIVIDQTIELKDEIIEDGMRRFREND